MPIYEWHTNDTNMKWSYILIFLFLFASIFVFAQETLPVTFPVEELGGCRNFRECADFCDKPENFKVCNDFSQAHGMVAPEQGERARQMLELVDLGGPGGCKGQEECETYCNAPNHMEECIIFAKEHNLIPPEELKEVEMVLAAIKKGVKPPPCPGKKACDIYCSQPEHLEECLGFGEAAGFISSEEAAMARKTGGKGPGECRGREECDVFCQDPANMEACINFGLEYGFIPPEEIEDVKKTLEALKKGVKPPNCRGREECDVYCSQPEQAEECVDFAVAAGFMEPEEAEQAKKMMKLGIISGPGNCKGKEECEAYCDNPENMLECVEFAEKAGFMTSEQAQQARKMAELGITGGPGGCKSKEECEGYCSQPEHTEECINFSVERGMMSPEEAEKMREMMPPPEQMMPSPEEIQLPLPPPETPLPSEGIPQTLLKLLPEFLANLAAAFLRLK